MAEYADVDTVWRHYFDEIVDVTLDNGDIFRTYRAGDHGPHLVLLHGAGYTSMTWSLVAAELRKHFVVHAIDFRGHGGTTTSDDADLSMNRMVDDVVLVANELIPADDDSQPQTIVAGHSMGGAVAVRVCESKRIPSIVGTMVVDVVEGTAMASLQHMDTVLSKRPRSFPSYQAAVDWSVHSGTCRNGVAAAVSTPSQLQKADDGSLVWRTNLSRSAKYWRDWFQGLSEAFLALPGAKILVLAGSDRLDTPLTRGQMMGKFELRLLYGCGHAIQEDTPDQLSKALMEFAGRCAHVSVRHGVGGGAAGQSENDVLAERLAKARAMRPTPMSAKEEMERQQEHEI